MRTTSALDTRGRHWELLIPTKRRERARGLLGRTSLRSRTAMLLPRARIVHTFGMPAAITVAFLDRRLVVVAVRHAPPGRFVGPVRGASHVLEAIAGADLRPDDGFQLVTAPSDADPTRRAYFARAPVE